MTSQSLQKSQLPPFFCLDIFFKYRLYNEACQFLYYRGEHSELLWTSEEEEEEEGDSGGGDDDTSEDSTEGSESNSGEDDSDEEESSSSSGVAE